MSNIIEYRAWDGSLMWNNVQNAYDFFNVESEVRSYNPYNSSIDFTSFGDVLKTAKSVMLYTGLCDYIGQKLYENDIVTFKYGHQSEPKNESVLTAKVIFDRGGFALENWAIRIALIDCLVIDGKITGCLWHESGRNAMGDAYLQINSVKKVGDIFHNPLLLENQPE